MSDDLKKEINALIMRAHARIDEAGHVMDYTSTCNPNRQYDLDASHKKLDEVLDIINYVIDVDQKVGTVTSQTKTVEVSHNKSQKIKKRKANLDAQSNNNTVDIVNRQKNEDKIIATDDTRQHLNAYREAKNKNTSQISNEVDETNSNEIDEFAAFAMKDPNKDPNSYN